MQPQRPTGPNLLEASSRTYSLSARPLLSDLVALVSQDVSASQYPLACSINKKIPFYDCRVLDIANASAAQADAIQNEWYHVLLNGPGVLVLKHMYDDLSVLDAANGAFANIIAQEKQQNGSKGDHFAPASANDRIWNSFSKHCLQDPASFLRYYSNPVLALICNAYLGPGYKITAQVNVVKPGGKAQTCHRDYHLGFQTAEGVSKWPKAMHLASQLLTLQGAAAHTDMPLESGPTRLLPFSQLMEDGFMAYRLPDFNDFFLENYVSLPLEKGDGLFFNPALFHAAGENTTSDFSRSANLFQVSSAFGKTMETVDSLPLIESCWTDLANKYNQEGLSKEVDAAIRAIADGYPFPTNLDRRPPAPGGMAPETEQDFILRALESGFKTSQVTEAIREMRLASAA